MQRVGKLLRWLLRTPRRRASLSLTAKHTLQRLHYGGVHVCAWLRAWLRACVSVACARSQLIGLRAGVGLCAWHCLSVGGSFTGGWIGVDGWVVWEGGGGRGGGYHDDDVS